MDEEVRIPPDDPIEKLVIRSVRLGEIAFKRRMNGVTQAELPDIEAMEDESEKIWEEAKKLGANGVTRQNWEALAAAIVESAVLDYEDLICGTEMPNARVNYESVLGFLEDQTLVKLDMPVLVDHIKNVFERRFIPYVKHNWKDILREWKEFDKKELDLDERIPLSSHRCPLCHGMLRPLRRRAMTGIGCSNCRLIYYIPFDLKEDKRCRKSETLPNTQL